LALLFVSAVACKPSSRPASNDGILQLIAGTSRNTAQLSQLITKRLSLLE